MECEEGFEDDLQWCVSVVWVDDDINNQIEKKSNKEVVSTSVYNVTQSFEYRTLSNTSFLRWREEKESGKKCH